MLSEAVEYLTRFAYDDKGNLVSKTDKEGKTTGYEYDELDRLKKVVDPLAGETEYTYDNRDNLTALTDAKGSVTSFEYDKNNRLVKEIRPLGQETGYEYDAAGNLIQKIDAKNQKTGYDYDDAGKLTSIEYFDPGDHVNPVKTVNFTYDKVGNLTGYSDGTTSATYGYDDLYRKVSESVNYGPFTKTNAYGYLKNGLKETFTGPDNIVYGYLYDNNNQLTGVQIPNSGFITIGEYNWNRPKSMILPGGSTKQFEYDPLMRVKSITAKDPGQNDLLSYQYDYDKMDNITEKATEHGEYSYDYDDLYRLADVDNPDFDDEAFTYDGVGNRLTSEGVNGNWSYNTNNELAGYDNVSYVYDANGNMVKKTVGTIVTSYVYNTEDRLIEVWNGEVGTGSLTASYYYDPFGRRLWKEIGGVRTYFYYADEGLVAELDAAGNVTKSYGYKLGSTWGTDPLFMKVGANYYFYQNDHLGTPQKMTAVNGAVVWSAKYSSFGKATVEVETVENNLRFPGQYEDTETGLHYNYHRYYDPRTGRYLTPDPIGLLGGINPFVYSYNNPINSIDPLGLWEEDVHYGSPNSNYGTFTWAVQSGFSKKAAHIIGLGNNSVDFHYATSFLPGSQDRHFNTFKDDGRIHEYYDSRLFHAEKEYRAALKLFRQGYEDQALGRLGKGLHSLQDYFAHRDWDPGPLGVIKHPSWYDYWDDLKNKCATELTEETTKAYLKRFIDNAYFGYNY